MSWMKALFAGMFLTAGMQTPAPEIEFIAIPPGSFMMGCAEGDIQCDDDERPAHRVHITRPFEIGKYEVRQADWVAVMGTNPAYYRAGLNRPVELVSWNDAQEFIARLNERNDGYRYRLPTEAEWEYAARAGSTGVYAGDSLDEMAWYEHTSNRQTQTAGRKAPNAWGLHDIHGNVAEYTQDWWSSTTYQRGEATDPQGPEAGEEVSPDGVRFITVRVAKGGSWDDAQWSLRISARRAVPVNERSEMAGFRLVRERIVP